MIPPIASNFVAGETPEAAMAHVERLNARGVHGILNLLGEQYERREAAFEENLARVVEAADCFVWIDMEDHTTTDATLDAFERHTREDLERLADLPRKVRLVKGAYDEPAEIAYTNRATVDEMYREDLAYMFEAFDDGVAVGSHDPAMIDHAWELHVEHGTPFEMQMLTGVRERAQFELAEECPVYQYIPHGSKWFSYFYRRVRERKSNALFALRAIVGS